MSVTDLAVFASLRKASIRLQLQKCKVSRTLYRLERAEEMLKTARRDLDAGDYASANNRAYYCVFHAITDAEDVNINLFFPAMLHSPGVKPQIQKIAYFL